MTIAVGIISPLFVIVAADTQEGWGDIKRPSRKIYVGTLTKKAKGGVVRGRIAITGAGGSDYLAYLKSRIAGRIQESEPSPKTFTADVQGVLEAEMVDFYTRHYAPVAHLDAHRFSEPSLIVGGVFGEARGMWRTHGSTVQSVPMMGYEAVGTGAVWAREILDSNNISFLVNEHAATLTACYAVYSAKERDGYCGKDTHLASLRPEPPLLEWADPAAIRAAEDVFRSYDDLQALMLKTIITPPKMSLDIAADQQLNAIRSEFGAINFYPTRQHRNSGE